MADNSARPIIIKRKKVVAGGGHHGGAWKVAYADFVTAMMAFFMLMWLLNATTEQQRKGIADYFSPTVPIARISGGGDGAFGGDSPFSETVTAQNGTGASNRRPTEGRQAMGVSGTSHTEQLEDATAFADIADQLIGQGADSDSNQEAFQHVQTRMSEEGLVIEIFSRPDAPIFLEDGSASDILRNLAPIMANLFTTVTNPIAIAGFVPAEAVVVAQESRWQRSTDNAQTMRMLLEGAGIEDRRIHRVTGHADRTPATADPMSTRNDRIEVILLRRGP